jgi:hypothetical protein
MDFGRIADVADMLAAIGVIVSLLFLAYEVRRNTNEVKRTAWEGMIDRFNALWSRTTSERLPEILDRGRNDFESLSGAEKVIFGNYHNEMLLTYEAMIVVGKHQALGEQITHIPIKHLRYYFAFPGARQWWVDFSETRGLSPLMEKTMLEVLSPTT